MFGTGPALLLHYADLKSDCCVEAAYAVYIVHGFGAIPNGVSRHAFAVRLARQWLRGLNWSWPRR